MEQKSVFARIKHEGISFLDAIGKANEPFYLVLLTLYVGMNFVFKIAWTVSSGAADYVNLLRYSVLAVLMWGSALYLFFVIVTWKNLWNNNILLIILAAVILTATYYFSKRMSTNVFGVVMDVFLCLMAYKKDYRKMLRCILAVSVVILLIAAVGVPAGITVDVGKPGTSTPGHSLGIDYPNTWGYLAFLGLIVFWYLYLRSRHIATFILFWAVTVFMFVYIRCRTIAGITLIFPFLALLTDKVEAYEDHKAEAGTMRRRKPLEWLITAIPFLSWAFMMVNSLQVEWWHQFYHGPLRNLAWRFIQGGLYFRTYGLPLIGNPYRSNVYTYRNINGEIIQVGILDSSFAAYIIMRGLLWLTYTLLWLCIAHWKALKKRDYAIIMLETILLGFAMMERPGLEMWYNFILLYPLAKAVGKPGTEKALEFEESQTEPDISTSLSSQ